MKLHITVLPLLLSSLALSAQVGGPASVKSDRSDADVQAAAVAETAAPLARAEIDSAQPSDALPAASTVLLELPVPTTAMSSGESQEEETISVDFPDEDVRVILRNVADLYALNLVIPDSLKGRTSIKLREVTWQQVFEVVLDPLGYTHVEDRNIIRIKSQEELNAEPLDTRVFIANYARAQALQSALVPLINSDAGGRVEVDVRSNALIVTERPSRMNKIQEIIDRLDRATDQVLIESKFIEITNNDSEKLGINWAGLDEFAMAAGSALTAKEGSLGGITRSYQSVNGAETRIDNAVFSGEQFDLLLNALNTTNGVELISNPTVVTLNNTKAKIAIGDKYPIPQYSFNKETGEKQLDEIKYEDIGITLEVTPQVNSAGFINLNILPEVSSSEEFAIIEDTQIPIIKSRRTETSIVIKDGYTLAIGGLVDSTVTNDAQKVPLLGDLPGVGRLFRSKQDKLDETNLVIFITAKTLSPEGSSYDAILDPRLLNNMGILPSDIPGYQMPEVQKQKLRELRELRDETVESEALKQIDAEIGALKALNAEPPVAPAPVVRARPFGRR